MQPETWIGVMMGALALVGTIASNINNRKTARDKMEFDAKLVKLESDLSVSQEKHQACEESTTEIKAELQECREQHKQAESRFVKNDERIAALEAKIKG